MSDIMIYLLNQVESDCEKRASVHELGDGAEWYRAGEHLKMQEKNTAAHWIISR